MYNKEIKEYIKMTKNIPIIKTNFTTIKRLRIFTEDEMRKLLPNHKGGELVVTEIKAEQCKPTVVTLSKVGWSKEQAEKTGDMLLGGMTLTPVCHLHNSIYFNKELN